MISNSSKQRKQQTVKTNISMDGIGLHSGKKVTVIIEPAKTDNGIKFIRTDKSKNNIINAK